jgi:hypothetical protein
LSGAPIEASSSPVAKKGDLQPALDRDFAESQRGNQPEVGRPNVFSGSKRQRRP